MTLLLQGRGSVSAAWYPESYTIQPHYSTMPPSINIDDAVIPTLTFGRRRWWTEQRDRALAMWAVAGFEFPVKPADAPYGHHRVTMDLAQVRPAPQQPAWAGFETTWWCRSVTFPTDQGDVLTEQCGERLPELEGTEIGWLQIDIEYFEWLWQVRKSNRAWANGRLKYLVAHEFGHCLGFGHGGTGVMASSNWANRVSAEEIAAAKTYWGIE